MNCPACGQENPDVARFCNRCGARFAPTRQEVEESPIVETSCGFVGRQQELGQLKSALEYPERPVARLAPLHPQRQFTLEQLDSVLPPLPQKPRGYPSTQHSRNSGPFYAYAGGGEMASVMLAELQRELVRRGARYHSDGRLTGSCPFLHTSGPCDCDQGGGGTNPVPDWPARAKEVGVELIAAAVYSPAHVHFFTVETDNCEKLRELFRPYLGLAKADIVPVRDLMAS